MPKVISATGAFIFNDDNEVFLGQFREKFDQLWSIPGGKIEFGETPEQAVRREIKEETNLDIESFEFFTQGSFTKNDSHVVYIDFIAKISDATQIKINSEFKKWGFFTRKDLDALPVIPETKITALKAMRLLKQRELGAKLESFKIGRPSSSINLTFHQPAWKEAYSWLKQLLSQSLHGLVGWKLDHVGSTAIKGLVAKPNLDLQLTYEDNFDLKGAMRELQHLGFTDRGDILSQMHSETQTNGRRFMNLKSPYGHVDYVHLHLLDCRHPHAQEIPRFCSLLQNNPTLCQEYGDLKIQLQSESNSRQEYTKSKAHFICQAHNK